MFQIHIANGLPAMAIVGLADMAVAETRERVRAALAFDGVMQPVSGVLPAAIDAVADGRDLICPHDCGSEAAWAKGLSIIAPPSLTDLVNHIHGRQVLHPPTPKMAPARQKISLANHGVLFLESWLNFHACSRFASPTT